MSQPISGQSLRSFLATGLLASGFLALSCLAGCSTEPSAGSLRDSFSRQIEQVELVQDFEQKGDTITFSRLDGAGELIEWQVHIDSAVVEKQDDESMPFKGTVKSSWRLDGQPVAIRGDVSGLPMWILETGISQDCYALWEADAERWGWT